jgi:hypothetical protein
VLDPVIKAGFLWFSKTWDNILASDHDALDHALITTDRLFYLPINTSF